MNPSEAKSALANIGKGKIAEPIVNVILFILFAILEQLYVDENFKCPCYTFISEEDEAEKCSEFNFLLTSEDIT